MRAVDAARQSAAHTDFTRTIEYHEEFLRITKPGDGLLAEGE